MIFLAHAFMKILIKDEYMGAQTTLHYCYISSGKLINGGYYKDCNIAAKGEKIRKYDIEKKIHLLTFNAINNSEIFKENLNKNKDFEIFMEFFRKKIKSY